MDDRTFIIGLGRAFLGRSLAETEVTRIAGRLKTLGSRGALTQEFMTSQEAVRLAAIPIFAPPGHFYSPVVDPAMLQPDRLSDLPEHIDGIALDREAMIALWQRLLPAINSHPFADQPEDGRRYGFVNPAFQWPDALILHAMIREFRPRRILEIGSGWSSACAVDTVEHFLPGACDITMADPYPELAQDLVGEYQGPHRFLRTRLQDMDPGLFAELETDDILFVDSTHVLATGSDVHRMLFDILPVIRPGVLVHFHDIFWPFDYPDTWVRDENRSWNEAYALRAYLTDNPRWQILWLADYFRRFEGARLAADCPSMTRVIGGSLWLRKLG